MTAIPDTGGAESAPRGVMRALLRLVVLGTLVTVGWLLGSGTSHADDDLGQPDTGLIHIINTASASDDRSGDLLGGPSPVRPAVKNVLSGASVPRLPVQPPAQVRFLRPVVNSVSVAKPLAQVLTPASRPLSGTAQQHPVAPQRPVAQSLVPADQPAAERSVTPAAPTPVTSVRTAVRPAVALGAPAEPAAHPMAVPVAIGDGPVAPMPASPPGGTTSPSMIGGSGGSSGAKGASDVAVRDGWEMESLLPPHGLSARDTSDLPGSLAAQPSTSPD
ncbi:MAG: hypothetical protein ACRDRX_13760 [Pseudonocardiaceae bacterium]